MKAKCQLVIASLAMAHLSVVFNNASAELVDQSKEKLQASASHILLGTVERTYERKEQRDGFEYTYMVAEISVERVEKGADVVANDRVFVRYWRKEWLGNGNPPTDHFGHRGIPTNKETAEIYVRGDRKTGFDVLSPNGFFKITKLKTSQKAPSPPR